MNTSPQNSSHNLLTTSLNRWFLLSIVYFIDCLRNRCSPYHWRDPSSLKKDNTED